MLLKRHLCNAGFRTWTSLTQLGGGEKVNEQTEQGIRAAQVIICCVSSKYANSNTSSFSSEVSSHFELMFCRKIKRTFPAKLLCNQRTVFHKPDIFSELSL